MMNTSISSSEDELDNSFRKMLLARKPKTPLPNNKENIPPSASSIENDEGTESDYDDYDDEDFDAGLHADGAENEEERKAMERLLNEIRSPVKMIEMLRPSTILEEPSMISNNSSTHTNSFVTAQSHTMHTTAAADDNNMSKDSLMPSGWSIDSSATAERKKYYDIEADSLMSTKSKDQFNETLEEMEYVKDNSKYLLQPVNKVVTPHRMKLSRSLHTDVDVKSPENVILIESSPESSFETAKNSNNCFRVDDVVDVPIKVEEHCESITISDDDDDDDDEPVAVNSFKQKCNDGTLDGISSLNDDSTHNTTDENDSAVGTNDSTESILLKSDAEIDDQFNDTIERMEFMMKKGQELLASGKVPPPSPIKITSKQCASPSISSPRSFTNTPTKSTASSAAILRQRNTNSPSSAGKLFKKPDSMLITPGVIKKPPMYHQSDSKIPRPKFGHQNRKIPTHQGKFNHIISPVSMYINKIAPSPLQTDFKPMNQRDFFDTTISNQAAKELNFSVASNDSLVVPDYVMRVPKKAYISAPKRYLTDQTTTKVPGGQKIHKVIGQPVQIIRHDGLIDMNIDNDLTINESLADLSLMPGDVSVQVKRDVKYFH